RKNAFLNKTAEEKNIHRPRPFASFTHGGLVAYAGVVLIPGGHTLIPDLDENPETDRTMWHFHNLRKPAGESSNHEWLTFPGSAALCRAEPLAISTKDAPKSLGFPYEGYQLTSQSDAEERLV
ncbi:hypothetical protein FOMPIDRAFT_41893, partial [Fomitopsis schrenkii]